MKKILYSVVALATLGFATSCSEDKGTSTEVSNANRNETVDRSDIRNYDRPGVAGKSIAGTTEGAGGDEKTAEELTREYYIEPNRPMFTGNTTAPYSETNNTGVNTAQPNTTETNKATSTKNNQAAGADEQQQGAQRRATENTKENNKQNDASRNQ